MLGPDTFRLGHRFDASMIMSAHVTDTLSYPLDILLAATGNVAERRAIVRTNEHEQIGESNTLKTKIRARPIDFRLLCNETFHSYLWLAFCS
jgi:hypothetical protein